MDRSSGLEVEAVTAMGTDEAEAEAGDHEDEEDAVMWATKTIIKVTM
jgi:hypothetical protein